MAKTKDYSYIDSGMRSLSVAKKRGLLLSRFNLKWALYLVENISNKKNPYA